MKILSAELEVAEAHYRDSLAIKPQPAIYNDLGVVLDRQGLTDEATRAYRKAIEADPTNTAARQKLAEVLENLVRKDEARRESETAKASG